MLIARKVLLGLCILWVVQLCVGLQSCRKFLLFPLKKLNEAVTEARKEMVWLQGFLNELGKKTEKGVQHSHI